MPWNTVLGAQLEIQAQPIDVVSCHTAWVKCPTRDDPSLPTMPGLFQSYWFCSELQ